MIVEEHLEHKYVAIWVANFEKYDKQVQTTIRKIIDDNHKKKIKTVVYRSGTKITSTVIRVRLTNSNLTR